MVTVVDLARDPAPIRRRTASRTLGSDVNVIVAIPEKEGTLQLPEFSREIGHPKDIFHSLSNTDTLDTTHNATQRYALLTFESKGWK